MEALVLSFSLRRDFIDDIPMGCCSPILQNLYYVHMIEVTIIGWFSLLDGCHVKFSKVLLLLREFIGFCSSKWDRI